MTPDKSFFIGTWKVCEEDADRPDHPVKIGHNFEVISEKGDEVSFKFAENFGDGCWNQHVWNGHFADGKIEAPVKDDKKCKPAPKNVDTFSIEQDSREPGVRKIRCKVFEKPIPGALARVETAGEFGAEDGGG